MKKELKIVLPLSALILLGLVSCDKKEYDCSEVNTTNINLHDEHKKCMDSIKPPKHAFSMSRAQKCTEVVQSLFCKRRK